MWPGFHNHQGVAYMRSPSGGGGEMEEEGKEDEEGGGGDGGSGGCHRGRYHMIPRNNCDGGDNYELLADALLFEPLSYRLAIREGLSEGITSVLSALGFLNPGLHLMQTLYIFETLSRAHKYYESY